MGRFKHKGDTELALVEEMAELTQVILKKHRFNSEWYVIPSGKHTSRAEQFLEEARDILFHLNKAKEDVITEMSLFCKDCEINADSISKGQELQYLRYMDILMTIEREKIAEHYRTA